MAAVGKAQGLPDLSTYDARSILVVRLKALGDIVLSLPIVHALRRRYPNARIRYLCQERYGEALSGVKELDEVIILPRSAAGQVSLALGLKREMVDCVIDLLGSPRSAYLTCLTGAAMRIGMDTGRRNWCYTHLLPRVITRNGERVKCYTLESNRELVRMLALQPNPAAGLVIGFPAAEREKGWAWNYIGSIGVAGKKIIGFVPGSAYQAKSWLERHFVELTRLTCERLGAVPVMLWGPGEEALAKRIAAEAPGSVCAPPMGIARLGALVAALDLVVGIDSGPKHLAVIQGVPTVTLFGPTDPRIWDPMTGRHRVLQVDVDCSPCKKKRCRANRCLSGISPLVVLKEMSEVLGMEPGEASGAGKDGCA